MKFRSRSNTNWNLPVRDDARPSSPASFAAIPDLAMHDSSCMCQECQAAGEFTRMRWRLRGTWGELV